MITEIDFETILPIWKDYLWPMRKSAIEPTQCRVYGGGTNRSIEQSKPVFFAYIENGKILGVNSGYPTPNRSFRSRGLWVDPNTRGKGIGKKLLQATIDYAAEQEAIYIWTMPRKESLYCYESVGFEKTSDYFEEECGTNCYAKLDIVNSNYCPLPFILLATLPSGQTRLCCKTVNNHVPDGNLNTKTVDEVWNSDYYEDVREQMLGDKYPAECEVCYQEDRLGKRSMRLKELEIWGKVEKAKDPYYLDLRMGNLCNLKCRTCDPVSSSQIHKEGKQYDYSPVFFRQKMEEADVMQPWWEKEDIKRLLPTAKLLWMSGGEPTLVQAGKEFIDYCIENDYAKDIKLRYVVNLTNVTDDFISKFEQFKSVDFHCSIDGLYEVNDYLRYPSHFNTVINNLRKIENTNANLVMVIYTVSVFNVYHIPEFIEFLEMYDRVAINFNPLNEPHLYHMNILDDSTKQLIKDRLLSFDTTPKLTNEINSIIKLMETQPADINQSRRDFYQFVNQQDKVRKQDFLDTFPELEGFYLECKKLM